MSFKKTLLAAGLVAAATSANALPITGGFEFFASGTQVDTNADTIFDAFDFSDIFTPADGILDADSSSAAVNAPITGTFASAFGVTTGVGSLFVKDISAGAPASNNPLVNLLIDNGLGLSGAVTFTATSATMVDGSNPLDLAVNGYFEFIADGSCTAADCASYVASDATWYIASTGQNSIVAAPVSEPATLAMLGLGLAGLGFARRKQAKA